MAIDKNFVVKNGLEVKSNLLVADTSLDSVGIGTSYIKEKLHVIGGVGATTLYVGGIGTVHVATGNTARYDNINISGVSTALESTILGITSTKNLIVSGVSTFQTGFTTNLTALNLNVTGVTTFAGAISDLTATNLTAPTGVSTNFTATNLGVTGVSTFTGDSTFGGQLNIPDAIVHSGNDNAKIRFSDTDIVTVETAGSERLRIASDGKVLIGTTSDVAPDSFGSNLQIDSGGAAGSIAIGRHTDSGSGPILIFHKSRSGSGSGNTIVQDGDALGGFRFYAADGNNRNSYGADISVEVDGTPGSNDIPGRIKFATTADGASTPTERIRIDSGGDITFKGASSDGLWDHSANAFVANLTGNVTGDLTGTADLATSVTVSANNDANETVYPIFVDGTTGTQGLESDTTLTYNPFSGTLTATTFAGNLTGTVDSASNASNINVAANNADETVYPIFVDGSTGNQKPESDAGFTYNPANGNLTASIFTGNLLGNVYSTGISTVGFLDATGVSAGLITATTFTGDLTGTADLATNVTVSANDSVDETVYPIFVDGTTGTQGAESHAALNYNPNTGELTAGKFTGDGSGLTDLSLGGEFSWIRNHTGIATVSSIGIGTTSAYSALTVKGDSYITGVSTFIGTTNGLQARFGGEGTGLGIQCAQKTNANALVKLIAQDSTYGTLAFETAGAEVMRITSGGNIGINDNDPDNKLHITTNDDTDYNTNTLNTTNTTNALLKLQNLNGGDGTGVNNYVGIDFSVSSGAISHAQLNYVRTGNNAGAFKFKARNASSTYPNLMTIKSDGNIGIGTDDPINSLHLHSNSAGTGPILQLSNDTGDCRLFFGTHSTTADANAQGQIRYNVANNYLSAYTAGSERLRINSDGDVGVGDDSPSCRLAVKDVAEHTAYANVVPNVTDSMLQLYNNPPNETVNDHATIQMGINGGSHNRIGSISAVAESASNRKLALTFCTDSGSNRNERMRITGDGQVWIGGDSGVTGSLSNTTWNLSVNGSGDAYALIAGTTGAALELRDTASSESVVLAANGGCNLYAYKAGDSIAFHTKPSGGSITDRLIIDSSGNVGISEDSSMMANGLLTLKFGTDKHMGFNATQGELGSMPGLVAYKDDGSLQDIGIRGNIVRFATSTNERLRIDSNGRVIIGHTASVPVDSHNVRLQIVGTDLPSSSVFQQRYQNSDSGATLILSHSRNATKGSHTILQTGDEFGKIRFHGSDGVDFNNLGAEIKAKVDSTPGADNLPGRLEFYTLPSGGSSTERLRIDSSGRILIGDAIGTTPPETFSSAVLQAATAGGATIVLGRNDSSVTANDGIGSIYFDVNDSSGNAWNECARITVNSDGAHADGDYPSRMQFYTTASGAGSLTERLRISSGGEILAGNYFTSQAIGDTTSAFQIQGTSSNTSSMSIFRYTNDDSGPIITLGKSRGSGGSVTKPNNGDNIGTIRFMMANNNDLVNGYAARIDCNVDAAPGGGDTPGRMTFWTSPDGSSTPVERLRITSAGAVVIGGSDSSTLPDGFGSALQIHGTGSTTSSISVTRNSNSANPAYLTFAKSRGTSVGSNTAVAIDDNLGDIDFKGSDGSGDFNLFAKIRGSVHATPGNSDAPGRLTFHTTADGGISNTEQLRITSDKVMFSTHLKPNAHDTLDLATSSTRFRHGYFTDVTATTFTGALTGNSTSSDTVDITNLDGNDATYYPTFTDNNGSGKTIGIDAGLTFNPSTNTLSTGIFSCNQISITDNGASSPILKIKTDDASPYAMIVGNDTYNTGNFGLHQYQENGGNYVIRLINNAEYKALSIQTSDNTTDNTGILIDANRAVSLNYQGAERLITTTDGVDISGTGSIKLPVGTTAQRSASPTDGDFRFNSTLNQFEGYSSSAWGQIGGGAGGGEFNTSISEYANYSVTTSNADAFTVDASSSHRTIIHSIRVTNISATGQTHYVYANTGGVGANAAYIAYKIPIPAGSSVELLKKPKVMGNDTYDRTISMAADSSGVLHATISAEKQDNTDLASSGGSITVENAFISVVSLTSAAVFESILLTNTDNSGDNYDVTASVVWMNNSSVIQSYLAYEILVPYGSSIELLEKPLAMPSGHSIKVKVDYAKLHVLTAFKYAS